MKILFKTTSIILIQAFLMTNCAWAGNAGVLVTQSNTLSPQIHISSRVFYENYNFLFEELLQRQQKDAALELSNQTQFRVIDSGKTKKIAIRTVKGQKISIVIPSWQKHPAYKDWIIRQYGVKALASHPNLILKLIMDTMLKNKNIFKDAVILEAGVGDAMLAVLSSKLGAKLVYGVDNDSRILNIAQKVSSLNNIDNVHLIKSDFMKDELALSEQPTILLLNNGPDAENAKQSLLNKYSSLRYIIMAKEGKIVVEKLIKQSKDNPKFIRNISVLLKSLEFNYSDKFSPDFKLAVQTKEGRLLALMVTPDGEFAYALRKEILENGEMQINILELNPFGRDAKDFEKNEGYYGKEIEIDAYPKYKEAVYSFSSVLFNEETAKQKFSRLTLSNVAKKTGSRFIDFRSKKQENNISTEPGNIPMKARVLNMSEKDIKNSFYRINSSDFDCERNAGFWPVIKPIENIFSICTVVVFIDEDNNTFMAHFVVNESNPEDEISIWVEKWKKYGYIDGKKEVRWFNPDKLFKPATRALIINGHKNSPFSKRIKEFLVDQGLSDERVHITPVPEHSPINSLGVFIWPKDMLEIYYNESDGFNEKTCFEVKQYNVQKEFSDPKVLNMKQSPNNPVKKIDIASIQEMVINNDLIKTFFQWYEIKSAGSVPWEIILQEIFSEQREFIKEQIKEIESKGEKWIAKEGWKLHNEHPSRSSYSKSKRKNSWEEFVAESSEDEFNLAHLLNSTIGLVKEFRELGLEEKAIELFREGYIILRAIEIEAREYFEFEKMYRNDLNSDDVEVRLQAALALSKMDYSDDKTYEIIKQSAVNKNLPLSDRVKTHRFLTEEDKKSLWSTREDGEHFNRIESDNREDFPVMDLSSVNINKVKNQIRKLAGVDQEIAEELITRLEKTSYEKHELAKLSNAIEYFSGKWHNLLQERIFEDYGYEVEETDKIIGEGMPDGPFFNALDYTKAFIISQELASELSKRGIRLMSGDKEWLLLEAFVEIYKNSYNSQEIKKVIEKKWDKTIASKRIIDIFKNLQTLGLYKSSFMNEVETDFIGNTAQQFIYRAYYDSVGEFEYSPGPNYDQRGVSVGVENGYGEKGNSLHVNLGLSWASKFIWAAYLTMHAHVNSKVFNGSTYDFYYDQIIKEEMRLFKKQRRVSYIGISAKNIDDLEQIIDIFVLLSIALNNYTDGKNIKLAKIWREFRIEFEKIIKAQNDEQLMDEYFKQGKMMRFVELVSANDRNNNFYQNISSLIKSTLNKIQAELTKVERIDVIKVKQHFKSKYLSNGNISQETAALIEQSI